MAAEVPAEMVADEADFAATLDRLTNELGFRLELITPADDPRHAVLSRHDITVELRRADKPRPAHSARPMIVPELVPGLAISAADDTSWNVGRAGMRYRDLIPDRHGGRFIASHIEVCDGGPVPDLVHHHTIRFQMIFCQRGWVDVVYEDQGPAFRMRAGDGVLQPPNIRHRVLASSAGARVVEIGCPAEHDTLFDHDLTLPTDTVRSDRSYGGQRFVRHDGQTAAWVAADPHDRHHLGGVGGFEQQITGIADATGGLADVRVLRPASDHSGEVTGAEASAAMPVHDGEFDFVFVLDGSCVINVGADHHRCGEGWSASFPPATSWAIEAASPDLRVLSVRL